MERKRLFLDTYALVKIAEGSAAYEKYNEFYCSTSLFNLFELHCSLLRKSGKEVADLLYRKFESIVISFDEKHIKRASEVKVMNKMSYNDALGYAIAEVEGMKFLTGNDDFKGLENVEFVK